MTEEQFLALYTQLVDVADVIAIAVDVIDNDAARRWPLNVLAQVPRSETAKAAIRLHRPIHSPEAFPGRDDPCDDRHYVTALEILFNEFLILDAQLRRIDDQPPFLIRAIANAQETVGLGERECAQYAHLQIRTI